MVRSSLLRSALLVTTALVMPPGAQAGGSPPQAGAGLPQGGQFVAGGGRITAGTGSLTVTQSSRTGIVDWRSFSIGTGQRVQVNNGSGATLNRVTGNMPSAIAGTLAATGSVYLVNPQGIVVMPGGKVVTGGGFVASTRPVNADRFMQSGDLTFSGAGPGTVVNQGTIIAGGNVVLHGAEVGNSGTVQAGGQAVLAASSELLLHPVGDTARVVVRGAAGDVRNEGRIEAAEIALRAVGGNVYALAGNRGAYLRATGTVARNGRVLLVAGADVQVDAPVVADGDKGGAIVVRAGGTASVSGSLSARGLAGQGGRIAVSGRAIAIAGTARIDASGATQGGTIGIGGKPPGHGATAAPASRRPAAPASETSIAAGASLVADGGSGTGGQIVVWSDQRTAFDGTLSARGGTTGGMAEVSSAGVLDYRGRADLRGAAGAAGTLLLDPTDVVITSGSAPAGVSRIDPAVIADQLNYSNFTVVTGAGDGAGDITVATPLTWMSANTLTLSAVRNINVNAGLTNLHGGSLVLRSDSGGSGVGTVAFGAAGSVRLVGGTATLLYNPSSYTSPTSYARFVTGRLSAEMLVNTPTQLAAMGSAPNGAYALGRDLDLTGSGFGGLREFGGLLDGQGYTISNFTSDDAAASGAGLLGTMTAAASVVDLRMTNAHVRGNSAVGILAGSNAGTIRGVTLDGTVAATSLAGGVVGTNTGTIAEASVTATVAAENAAGGIAGRNDGRITNVAAAGTVQGSTAVGGIVGINAGKLASAYAANQILGGNLAGPLVGQNPGAVSSGYFGGNAAGPGSADTGIPLAGAAPAGGLPPGLDATAWYLPTGSAPALRNVPGATPYLSLGGRVLSDAGAPAPGVPLSVLVDRTTYGGIAADAEGNWSLVARSVAGGSNVLALLPTGPLGNTIATRVSQSVGTLDISPQTLRFFDIGAGATSETDLLLARGTFIRPLGHARGLLIPATPVAGGLVDFGTFDLGIGANGSLLFDRGVVTQGTMTLDTGGAMTQYNALHLGGLRLQTSSAVTLANHDNQIGTITGSVGSIDLVTLGGLDIGAAGLASASNLTLQVSGRLTLNGPLTAASTGDALAVYADALAVGDVRDPLRVTAAGRWHVYLPDPAALSGAPLDAAPLATDQGGAPGSRLIFANAPAPSTTPASPSAPPLPAIAAKPTAVTLAAAARSFVPFNPGGPQSTLAAPADAGDGSNPSSDQAAATTASPSQTEASATPAAAAAAPGTVGSAPQRAARQASPSAAAAASPAGDAPSAPAEPSVQVASLTPGPATSAADSAAPPASAEAPTSAPASVAQSLDNAAKDAASSAEAAGIAPAAEAAGRFSARANEVLAAGGSPQQAQRAGAAALQQLMESKTTAGPAPPAMALGIAIASGGAVPGPEVAAALAAGHSPAAAMAMAAAAAATRSAMAAEAAVPVGRGGEAAMTLSEGGPLSAAVTPAFLAALASGASPRRAAELAEAARLAADAALQAVAVVVPEAGAAAALLAQGSAEAPSGALLLALASGSSAAEALERSRLSATTLAAMQASSEVPGRTATLSALADGAALPDGHVLDRNGIVRPDRTAMSLVLAAVPPRPGDGGVALAQGGVPAALLEEMAQAPELRAALATALAAGLDVNEAIDVARAGMAQRNAMLAQAAVEADTLALQLAAGRVDDAYFGGLAAGADLDRFTAVLGAALQQHMPTDLAVRLAREATSPLAAAGHRPIPQLTRTGP